MCCCEWANILSNSRKSKLIARFCGGYILFSSFPCDVRFFFFVRLGRIYFLLSEWSHNFLIWLICSSFLLHFLFCINLCLPFSFLFSLYINLETNEFLRTFLLLPNLHECFTPLSRISAFRPFFVHDRVLFLMIYYEALISRERVPNEVFRVCLNSSLCIVSSENYYWCIE